MRGRLDTFPGELQGFVSDRCVSRHVGPRTVYRGEATPRPEVPRIVRMIAQQCDGSAPSLFRLDRGVAIDYRTCGAPADLQVEFERVARGVRFGALEHLDAAGELHRRFV